MLIPILPSWDVDDFIKQRLYAACGMLVYDHPSTSSICPPYEGRQLAAGPFDGLGLAGEYLNDGIKIIYVEADQVNVDTFLEAYPANRVMVRFEREEDLEEIVGKGKISCFQLVLKLSEFSSWMETCIRIVRKYSNCTFSVVLKEDLAQVDEKRIEDIEQVIGDLHRAVKDHPIDFWTIVHGDSLVKDPPKGLLSPARALLKCTAPSDRPDGLIATVVSDERGISLGLVYSNQLSVIVSIAVGRGVYWSRSRNELWRKGDTSGAIQDLIQITPDCDQDCLKFTVIQRGDPPAFCHTGDRTCWGPDSGLSHLFRTLVERKKSAPHGSYTARLYSDMNLLRDKLLEEAAELAEAVKGVSNGSDITAHVEEETADVLYFALAACVAGGGNLFKVEKQLDKRSLQVKRRQGDAKQHRKDEAESALNRINEEKRLKQDNH